jgi:hypothetical protein
MAGTSISSTFYHEMEAGSGLITKNAKFVRVSSGHCTSQLLTYRVAPCVYVKYHEVAGTLPKNFVALGDAVMRSSPVNGFGVTKGIVGAVTLAGALDRVKGRVLPENFAEAVMISQDTRTGWLWDQAKEAGE